MFWAGGMAQVVEHLPSKCVLSSTSSIAKKKKRKRKEMKQIIRIDNVVKFLKYGVCRIFY
jgi:hypothetical protein